MKFIKSGIGLFLAHYITALLIVYILVHVEHYFEYVLFPFALPKFTDLFFGAVIEAPIVETLKYQLIPFIILRLFRLRNYYITLILLTVIFTAIHERFFDNLILLSLFTIICGVVANYFLQVQKKEGTGWAVVKTMFYHAVFNFTLLTSTYL